MTIGGVGELLGESCASFSNRCELLSGTIMKQRLHYSLCALFVPLICGVVFSQDVADEANGKTIEEKIKAVLRADHASDIAERFSKLFEAVGVEGLAELKQSPHDSIALQAAWEEVIQTIPEEINDKHPTFCPDVGKLNWFIGFLEGRTRIRVPKWWRSAVLDARANYRRNVYFPYQNWGQSAPKKSANRTTFTKTGDTFTLNVGGDSLQLSNDIVEALAKDSRFSKIQEALEEIAKNGQSKSWQHFNAHFTPTHCYLAVYDEICTPYLLACIVRDNGKMMWTTKGIGSFWGGIGGGVGKARVTVDVQNNQVLFFGCSGIAEIYVEAFRAEDGKHLFRFSNKFSEYR